MGVGGPMRAAGGYEGGMGMAQMGGQMAPMGGMAPMGQMGGMGMGMGCVSCQQNYAFAGVVACLLARRGGLPTPVWQRCYCFSSVLPSWGVNAAAAGLPLEARCCSAGV